MRILLVLLAGNLVIVGAFFVLRARQRRASQTIDALIASNRATPKRGFEHFDQDLAARTTRRREETQQLLGDYKRELDHPTRLHRRRVS